MWPSKPVLPYWPDKFHVITALFSWNSVEDVLVNSLYTTFNKTRGDTKVK